MHFQTLIRTEGLTDNDIEDIFRLLGVHGQYEAEFIEPRDLEIACGMGTVFFTARQKVTPPGPIIGIATLHVIHTGYQREGLVMRVEVPSDRRRQGIGIGLIQAIVGYASRARIPRLRLLHPMGDHDAERVFREHGFAPDTTNTLYLFQKKG